MFVASSRRQLGAPASRRSASPRTRQRVAALLLRRRTTTTSRRPGRPTAESSSWLSNRGHVHGTRRFWRMEARSRRADARAPLRGDHLEGAARLVTRWPARGVQLLPRAAVAPTLVDDRGRRRRVPTHLWRFRRYGRALVARRPAHRLRVERGRRHRATRGGGAGRARHSGVGQRARLPGRRHAHDRSEGRRRRGAARPHLGDERGRPVTTRRTTRAERPTTGSTARSAGSSSVTDEHTGAKQQQLPWCPPAKSRSRCSAASSTSPGEAPSRSGWARPIASRSRSSASPTCRRRAGQERTTCTCT